MSEEAIKSDNPNLPDKGPHPESELDRLRLARKNELVAIRNSNRGYSGRYSYDDAAYELESHWLEKDSTFISRGFPILFGSSELTPETRIQFAGRRPQEDYEFSWDIVNFLDKLVQKRNPQQALGGIDLPQDFILDMGCGRGIALEDIWAYYGPVLNLYLKGNTGHLPNYAPQFLEKGIELIRGGLTDQGDKSQRPANGYTLIMANQVFNYYQDSLPFVEFAFKNLSSEGIFPASYHAVFGPNIEIIDIKGQPISNPQGYLADRMRKLDWVRQGNLILIKAHPTEKLGLKFIKKEPARTFIPSVSWERRARWGYVDTKFFQITE
ncbi:hypothetical protein HYS93_00050 [Candidatus Daviesbacteria bacterium]|nr:hypothetical protein [Candidatus Daviesbacteria bacterium]